MLVPSKIPTDSGRLYNSPSRHSSEHTVLEDILAPLGIQNLLQFGADVAKVAKLYS